MSASIDQGCCKAAPRRARFVVIALIVTLAIAAGLAGAGGTERSPPAAPAGDRR